MYNEMVKFKKAAPPISQMSLKEGNYLELLSRSRHPAKKAGAPSVTKEITGLVSSDTVVPRPRTHHSNGRRSQVTRSRAQRQPK